MRVTSLCGVIRWRNSIRLQQALRVAEVVGRCADRRVGVRADHIVGSLGFQQL